MPQKAKGMEGPVSRLPHRSLNKSSSAPTKDSSNERSWFQKLGNLFKSLSSLDSGSRERAAREEDRAPTSLPVHAQPQATTPPVGIGASAGQRTAELVTRKQLTMRPPAKPPAHPTPLRSPFHNLGRMVSGMFKQPSSNESAVANVNPTPPMPAPPKPVTPLLAPITPATPTPVHSIQQPVGVPSAPTMNASRSSPPLPRSQRPAHARIQREAAPRSRRPSNIVAMSDKLPPGMDREVWCVEDYTDLQEIHAGYASYVYKAKCRLSKLTVALKVYHPQRLHQISQFQLLREARLHARLSHPSIIQLYAAFQQEDGVILVQEYADGGDLLQLLYESGSRLSERRAVRLVIEPLLRALHYLHAQSIIHRDIKLENILFTGKEMSLKLADFGLCLNLREERSVTRAGTLDYMAPEVLRCPTKSLPADNKERLDLAYNCSVDVWAVGIVAYELLNGVAPFTRRDREETERLINEGEQPAFQVHASDAAKEFVYSCLTRDSGARPSAFQMLRHAWTKSAGRPASGQAEHLRGSRARSAVVQEPAAAQYVGQSRKASLLAKPLQHGVVTSQDDDGEELVYDDEDERPSATLPNALSDDRSTLARESAAAHTEITAAGKDGSMDGGHGLDGCATTKAAGKLTGRCAAAPAARRCDGDGDGGGDGLSQQAAAEVQAALTCDARSSASDMAGVKMREYTASKPKNSNVDKQVWLATVEYINQMADTRRAGRQLQQQQAVVYRSHAGTAGQDVTAARQQSRRWREEDMQDALAGAEASPKRRPERMASDLSRHTTDAGYRSAARSRRSSFTDDDDESS